MPEVSWIRKAVNFTIAAVKHTADGFHSVSEKDYEERLNICNSCPELSPEQECRVCGCPVVTKAMWRSESCPIGKWISHPEAREGPSQPRGEPQKGQSGCNCGQRLGAS